MSSASLKNTTVYERKNYIANSVSGAVSGVIYKATINSKQTMNTVSGIKDDCIPDESCKNCLTEYTDFEESDDVDTKLSKIKKYGTNDPENPGICGGVCGCTLDNLKLENNVIAKFSIDIETASEEMKQDAVDTVMEDIQQEYGDKAVSGQTKSQIENMYDIVIKQTINDQQSLSTLQIINTGNFPNSLLKDVSMKISLNSTLKASTDVDSEYSSYLQTIIDEQSSEITEFVDTTVKQSFSSVWKQVKKYVYTLLLIIIILIILLVCLYIWKARSS